MYAEYIVRGRFRPSITEATQSSLLKFSSKKSLGYFSENEDSPFSCQAKNPILMDPEFLDEGYISCTINEVG